MTCFLTGLERICVYRKEKQVKGYHTMKEMATKEEFALAVLLESIEDGDIEAARDVLSRINNLGLELIVRAKANN